MYIKRLYSLSREGGGKMICQYMITLSTHPVNGNFFLTIEGRKKNILGNNKIEHEFQPNTGATTVRDCIDSWSSFLLKYKK